MKVTLITPRELSPELIDRWTLLQQADERLSSPYFRPEFTQAVAEVRDDVEVAVLEEGQEVVGFFPFQRSARRVGKPVGGPLSDCHGLIARQSWTCDARELLSGCQLNAWHFGYLPAWQEAFQPYHATLADAVFMDVSGGLEAYQARRSRAGSDELRETGRKSRQLARQLGGLRVESTSADANLLATLIQWKSQQYRSTGATDVFSFPWTVQLLQRLLARRDAALAGQLSVLYAGDDVAALHFGLRSGGVLHWWFPAYNQSLSRYSPGNVLLVELVRQAEADGLARIDLGKNCQWKSRFATGEVPVAEGTVDLRPLTRRVREGWRRTEAWLRQSPLRRPARVPARMVFHIRQWLAFH